MDLMPSPDQEEIINSVTSFVQHNLSIVQQRESWETGSPLAEQRWKDCANLGWFGLGVPEQLGGVGYGVVEEALLFRELGRMVVPGPFASTVLAAHALAGASNELFGQVLGGDCIVGLIGGHASASNSLSVFNLSRATLMLAITDDVVRLYDADELRKLATARTSIDPSADLWLTDSLPQPTLEIDGIGRGLLSHGRVLAAAYACGMAEATRDMAVEYAKNRIQFARPIGVNQAIKHRCAEMAVRAEAAWAQTLFASLQDAHNSNAVEFHSSVAFAVALDAIHKGATFNVQTHGSIGFTWEHNAHIYVERAFVVERQWGPIRNALADVLATTIQSG